MDKLLDILKQSVINLPYDEKCNIHASETSCIKIFRESTNGEINKSLYMRLYLAKRKDYNRYVFTVNKMQVRLPNVIHGL